MPLWCSSIIAAFVLYHDLMSETIQFTETFIATEGYWPNQSEFPASVQGAVVECVNLWLRGPGLWYPDKGYSSSGSPAIGASVSPLMVSNGLPAGVTAGGSVVRHATVPWAAGLSGNAYEGSTLLGAVSGALMVYVGGTLVTAGLSATGAPGFADSGVASTKGFTGSYSLGVAPYRSTTGAIGNISPISPVIAVKNNKGRITFPTPVTGQTHWLVYGTQRGQGSLGVTFRLTYLSLTALPVSTYGAGSTFDVEWFDGELGEEAPVDYNTPPSSVSHCIGMGDCMVAITSSGQVCPSIPGKPEAFPLRYRTFLAAREPVVAIIGPGADGVVYVVTANSLTALINTGSSELPILPRPIWQNTGASHGNAVTLAEDQIYMMAGSCPVRTHGGGEPDRSFAEPVQNYMLLNGWNSGNTTVTFAPDNHAVYYCKGTVSLPFMLAGPEAGRWSGEITIPSVAGGVTIGGTGYVESGSTLYALDRSGGTAGTPRMRFAFRGGPEGYQNNYKTLRYVRAASGNCTLKVYKNLSTAAAVITKTHTGPHGSLGKYNQKGVRSYSLEVSQLVLPPFRNAEVGMLIDPMHS